MSNVLVEDLGPIGRRRVRTATAVSLVVLAAVVAWALWTFAKQGQLDPAKWADLFDPATLRYLLAGLLNTFRAALAAMVGSIVIGFAFALMRLSRNAVVRAVAITYVEFFRSIPLLLAIFGVFFGFATFGWNLGIFWSLVAALVLYNSAVLSEIFRAGIKSLDRGQTEAAQAIGMRYWPMMRVVILPQAVRRMIPAIVAQLATLTKDVSLGFVISYPEFVARGEATAQFPTSIARVDNFQAYVFVGVVYFVVIWALARLATRLEVQQRRSLRAAKIEVGAGLEDIAALGEEADEQELAAAEQAGEDPDAVVDAHARARAEAADQGSRLDRARRGDRRPPRGGA